MTRPVTHVATTDIADMMNPGPDRRMELPGFAPEFVDFPHYIIRITDRIWHDREVGLCLDWYSADCAIHTLGGDITGAQTVVDNTWATLKAFPDRRLDADNVIWSDEGGGAFYSSHLITSKMTNKGDSDFGPATGRRVRVQTIADCLCRENRIVEEWLVRDNLAIAQQLGRDPDDLARVQARVDRARGFNLIEFHAGNRDATRAAGTPKSGASPSAKIAIAALESVWCSRNFENVLGLYDFRVGARMPGGLDLYGPDQLGEFHSGISGCLNDTVLHIDHIAEIPYLGEARDVAVRWSVTGMHVDSGRYGAATDAPIYILGVSQFRIMKGRIREEVTIWDDIAVRRQVETARLG